MATPNLELVEVYVGSPAKCRVFCKECAKDPEMYGDAIYEMGYHKYLDGQYPCGCSKAPRRTKRQYEILVRRLCDKDGFVFRGWAGEFKNCRSRILVSCPAHGELKDKSVTDFLKGRRCIECRRENARASLVKSDDYLISCFRENGDYHPDTTFTRSPKRTAHSKYRIGVGGWWIVTCSECGEQHETIHGTLMRGGKSCSCSIAGQRYAYINHVLDGSGVVLTIKFGITSHPKRRVHEQDTKSLLSVRQVGLWFFDRPSDCRKMESFVKETIPRFVISKQDMPDGWTETCDTKWQQTIEEIYESHSGRRIK